MIVSTMATEPLFVRNGALVYPIIYSSANVSLNVVPVEIDTDLKDMFLNFFDLNISTLSVQVIDTEETILKAHKRISLIGAKERNNQLFSVINVAVREKMKNSKNIQELKNSVNETLSKIGYELVA